MEFDACIQLVKEACVAKDIQPTPDSILDCATRIFNASRMNKPVEVLATDKQKAFLKKLGYSGEIDALTKDQASKLIDEKASKPKW